MEKNEFNEFINTIKEYESFIYNQMGIEKSDVVFPPEKNVNELPITGRLKKVLVNNEINTVKDIDQLINSDMFFMKGLGEKMSKELHIFMYQYQLGRFYHKTK